MATILISGCSSGFGRLAAESLAARGHRVYGGSRSFPPPNRSIDTTEKLVELELDVRDEASCRRAVEFVAETAGGLDVLVNNAGVMLVGPIEDCQEDEVA